MKVHKVHETASPMKGGRTEQKGEWFLFSEPEAKLRPRLLAQWIARTEAVCAKRQILSGQQDWLARVSADSSSAAHAIEV